MILTRNIFAALFCSFIVAGFGRQEVLVAEPTDGEEKPSAKEQPSTVEKKLKFEELYTKQEQPNVPPVVLVITSNDLKEEFERYVWWKTLQGKPARIVTVEDIEKDQAYKDGKDIQQKMRLCCLANINQGCRWVVLGGDCGAGRSGPVPARLAQQRLIVKSGTRIPADAYYISEKGWDTNGNGVFGEVPDDQDDVVYSSAKACIGRVTVRTPEDAKAYINKVIAYESRYPENNFATKFLGYCAVQTEDDKLDLACDTYIGQAWQEGDIDKWTLRHSPWDEKGKGKSKEGKVLLDAEHLVERINLCEYGKMWWHGHGFQKCWCLGGISRLNEKYVEMLTNTDAYPIITSVSCYTNQFDGDIDPCISERMLRRPDAGAICVISPLRMGMPVYGAGVGFGSDDGKQCMLTRILTLFWTEALTIQDNGTCLSLGESFERAKAEALLEFKDAQADKIEDGKHWCEATTVLCGDPTLDARAKNAFTPKVDVVASLAVSAVEKEVTVKTGTQSALTVCAWKGDEVYQTARTNNEGIATLSLAGLQSPGELYLTVSGPSANTVVRIVKVSE